MGGLQRIHEHSFNKLTRMYMIGATRPIRRWVSDPFIRRGRQEDWKENPRHHHPINWQDGKYYTDAGDEIPEAEVPEYIRENIATKPPGVSAEHPEQVIRTCQVCEDPIPSAEYEAHLVAHARRQSPNGVIDSERLVGRVQQTRRERRAEATEDRTPAAEE